MTESGAVAPSPSGDGPGRAEAMGDWLRGAFGPALCEAFFVPFHERYTAGLLDRIAPQDPAKSPTAVPAAAASPPAATASGSARPAPRGYNPTFRYPVDGLDHLIYRPRELYAEESASTLNLLAIVDGEGTRHLVRFRDPLMLPSTGE